MDLGLKNKTVFVTASGQGIGLAAARIFLREGSRVLVNDHDSERLKKAHAALRLEFGDNALCVAGDARDKKLLIKAKSLMLKNWKSIDILVPNLGSGKPDSADKLNESEWKRFFDINVGSVLTALNVFLPEMKKRGNGSVVLLASIVGLEATAAPFGYAAAKASLLTLTKNASREFAKFGVRVNAVAPGNIYFAGGRWEEIVKNNKKAVSKYIAKDVPLKRFGAPEEIASAVVFLASPASSFTTGACLAVDGGETKRYL